MSTIMPHWLTKQAAQNPNKIAIEDEDGNKLTFRELKELSQKRAYELYEYGVRKNEHIGLLMTNQIDMVIHIHALSYLKAVIVFLNVRLTENELVYQIEKADVKYVITEKGRLNEQEDWVIINEKLNMPNVIEVELASEIDLDEAFTMMFTSGTTGFPKAVIHTYGNHFWSAAGSLLNLKHYDDDKWLLPLPIFHVGGFSILMRSVIYGMSVFLIKKYEAEKVFHIIKQNKITIASFVTVMLQDFVDYLEKESYPKQLRTILLGGGAIPTPLLGKVRQKNIPVFQSYGMTETSSQIVTLSEQHIVTKHGSAGTPLFPAQLKVEADKGSVGEVFVKGPMVFHGYYKNEEANEASFVDGWFKTGDLGYLDQDDFLYVVERRSDLIISGGENIYPSEIEHVLLEIDEIKEVAVVGREDERWGQIPVAYLVCESEEANLAKIKEYVEKKLASYKQPKDYIFIDELPRTASNKIMRHRLELK